MAESRPGLLVLALAAFAAVTTEMLPVGLLSLISREFDLRESVTGLLVSLYAVMVMALAVPMTLATRRVDGKRLLVLAMASYCLSNALSLLAPSFAVFAAARALGGVTHAIFFSVCIGYASRLVPAERTGRALALVSTGPTAAFILGAPLATALGDAAGWRAAFAFLVALTFATALLLAVLLPSVATPAPAASAPGGSRRAAVAVIAANALTYLGQFTLYTYVTVVLLRSGAPHAAIAPLLFLFGAIGLAGLWRAAPLLDRDPRRAALTILGTVALGVLAVGFSVPSLLFVALSGVVWNAAYGPVASFFQSATIRTGALSPELSGAWINATANFGIAGGALLGGLVLDHLGVAALAWVGAAPILLALATLTVRRRAPAAVARTA
jgi:predicted MFS family arabinose efflux permease